MLFNKVKFNGNYLNDIEGLYITGISEEILPPITSSRKRTPFKDGSLFVKKELGEREITINFEIYGDDREDTERVKRELAEKVFTREEKELQIRDEKIYLASLDGGTGLDKHKYDRVGSLYFIASNPIPYILEREKVLIKDIVNPINYEGNYKTYPIFTFNSGAGNSGVKITNVGTGEYLELVGNVVEGSEIIVDFEREIVEVVGIGTILNEQVALESDWFNLEVGNNDIKIEGIEGNGIMVYKERWI